ncbi:ketosteroid isomerase-like protein [Chitinophaga dinghuensis]|uniref:Ketosteroid isomerase-like protein n=1 Tax=Chitinophaga dinghuensis TaxID=1539050 RepID=A0A327VUS6_9BACT|nr:nuclear transport factor 2 family protein [Chitinophaga dinghuensis]RAJ74971.1 ketosteroid isomerase-like protein [Chitinophaga dinghuensis]
MKTLNLLLLMLCLSVLGYAQSNPDAALLASLNRATAAIRGAFEKGDAELVTQLHSPDIIKYFGGKNVVTGREQLKKGLQDWFEHSKVEFVENKVENTIFNGEIAIQTSIFAIKTTPKIGGKASIGRGRSMVIYKKDKNSPTGWLSLREIVQEAPAEEGTEKEK